MFISLETKRVIFFLLGCSSSSGTCTIIYLCFHPCSSPKSTHMPHGNPATFFNKGRKLMAWIVHCVMMNWGVDASKGEMMVKCRRYRRCSTADFIYVR